MLRHLVRNITTQWNPYLFQNLIITAFIAHFKTFLNAQMRPEGIEPRTH